MSALLESPIQSPRGGSLPAASDLWKPYSNLFAPQSFSRAEEHHAIASNMAIDMHFGHRHPVETFATLHTEFAEDWGSLSQLSPPALERAAVHARSTSLLMTVLMLTGKCNADCQICYTDRRERPNALTFSEIKNIVDQTATLGSRLVYIPGDGEPTLDDSFLKLGEYCAEKSLALIIFTNGILFSNDTACMRRWGCDGEKLIRRIREYPVYVYHKLWTMNPGLLCEMMRIPHDAYQWEDFKVEGKEFRIPLGLTRLLRNFPTERVGIECVAEKRNLNEILDAIIPFVQATGIKSYIEPIIHAGRCFGSHEYDGDQVKLAQLAPWLARQHCRRMGYKCTVFNDGVMGTGMAISPASLFGPEGAQKLSVRVAQGVLDLFSLLHTAPAIVDSRYRVAGCYCEEMNLALARKQLKGI